MTIRPGDQPVRASEIAPASTGPHLHYETRNVTAWESIPKFIRFTVWVYAIFTVLGLVIWPILLIAILAL
jgi:hypothetical protein